jgi:predicted HAD superfamily Cof-like phosphohydrolase
MTQDAIEQLRSYILVESIHKLHMVTDTESLAAHFSNVFATLVDVLQYNTSIDALEFFEIVHTANMRKINPETGTAYVYKANGNIGKPEGFVGPEKDIQAKAEALGLCVT